MVVEGGTGDATIVTVTLSYALLPKQNRMICSPGLAFQRDRFCAVSLVLALSQDSPSLAMRRRGAAQGC